MIDDPIMQRRWWEQYRLLGEDRKELVGWWAERMMYVRQAEETVRQQKEKQLDQWAEYVLKLEAARQCLWKKKLLSSRTRLAFTVDDMESDRAANPEKAKESSQKSGRKWYDGLKI